MLFRGLESTLSELRVHLSSAGVVCQHGVFGIPKMMRIKGGRSPIVVTRWGGKGL